jgi:branched-chain amino acid transport system permease protein
MQILVGYGYQIALAFSIFVLISLGLAVIFGMMGVINLAQGEFLMLGAYACTTLVKAGLPLALAIVCAGVVVGLVGIVVERGLIRFLYGRVLDTILATWGLSLLMVGLVTTFYGPQSESVAQNLGSVVVGGSNIPVYGLVLVVIAVLMVVATYALWRLTNVGLIVRGTMQNPAMARAIGVNTGAVYMFTFGYGSFLTGLAGALLVPLFGASPTIGVVYIGKAFITVIAGGPLPLAGTTIASGLFGTVDAVIATAYSSVLGEIAVLLLAIVLLRLLPRGITAYAQRRG